MGNKKYLSFQKKKIQVILPEILALQKWLEFDPPLIGINLHILSHCMNMETEAIDWDFTTHRVAPNGVEFCLFSLST